MGTAYQGVIISSDNEDLAAVTQLLAARVRDKLQYVHMPTALELNVTDTYDFILVDNLPSLREVVKRYKSQGQRIPMLIHLVFADEIDLNHPYREFAADGVTIAPIRQAALDKQDTTLQLDLFERVLQILDAST